MDGHRAGTRVAGIDAADGLLEVAPDRLPQAVLRQGALECLPYPDDTFEIVASFDAVQLADPVAALREAKRVATPGGEVAIVTFGDPERCGTRSMMHAVGRLLLLLPPPPPGAIGPFALSAPGQLEDLAACAGLTPDHADEVAGEHAVRDTLTTAFAPARQPEQTYRQDNVFRYLIATAEEP